MSQDQQAQREAGNGIRQMDAHPGPFPGILYCVLFKVVTLRSAFSPLL